MATEFREESSVSFHRNEFDELVFHSDRNGEVIHRTPEELGLARVVKDTPPERRIDIRPEWSDRPGGNSMSRARAKRDAAPKLHAIRGVQVRMSAYSSMGAEMIDLIADEEEKKILVTKEQGAPAAAAEQTKRSETAMSGRNRLHDPETKAKILAESSDTPAGEIAKKYGVETSYVYYLRGEARKRGGASEKQPRRRACAKPVALARPVEIAPERPGTASALLDALARQDGAAVRIEIELTAAELAKVLGGLGDAQRAAFLGNGLRAALLA